MEEVIACKANNGKLFETADSCRKYESKLARYPKIIVDVIKADDHYIGLERFQTPIVKHIEKRWEKPSSTKKEHVSYIIGDEYRITPKIFPIASMDLILMHGYVFKNGKEKLNTCWDTAPCRFAEIIILGRELTDETVFDEIEKINLNNEVKLSVEVLEPNKKWHIENPRWKTGAIVPRIFEIEKL